MISTGMVECGSVAEGSLMAVDQDGYDTGQERAVY